MSDNHRSQTAINLLLTNNYTGANLNNMASSALFSFLQSQLNAWAAQTLPGVDLSFGIKQYEGVNNGTETSYSYRLAKSLFNDRFKIVVGGEYNTEAANEEKIANNLFNDISLEYYLNNSGNRYLRLYHRARYESLLDAQVMETGVAYVLEKARREEYKLLEKTRKAAIELQEKAIDKMNQPNEETVVPDDDAINRPTVNRKKEDESEP